MQHCYDLIIQKYQKISQYSYKLYNLKTFLADNPCLDDITHKLYATIEKIYTCMFIYFFRKFY